mgnify:CR=1 FL=1
MQILWFKFKSSHVAQIGRSGRPKDVGDEASEVLSGRVKSFLETLRETGKLRTKAVSDVLNAQTSSKGHVGQGGPGIQMCCAYCKAAGKPTAHQEEDWKQIFHFQVTFTLVVEHE